MAANEISHSVRRLIVESIDTVSELEAVLLLRDNRDREWAADEAAARLYVSPAVGAYVLAVLTKRGFLAEKDRRYRFAPQSPAIEAAVAELAAAYAQHLIAVTQIIHSKPAPSVLNFADAFRMRKDE